MNLLVDITSWILFSVGGGFVFIGGASLTDSMGTILVIFAIMLQAGWSLATLKLLTILVFLMLTGPTASYALANAALLSGLNPASFKKGSGD